MQNVAEGLERTHLFEILHSSTNRSKSIRANLLILSEFNILTFIYNSVDWLIDLPEFVNSVGGQNIPLFEKFKIAMKE